MTLLEKVRCKLSNVRLSKSFLLKALAHVCHLINRLPLSAIGGNTPLEFWLRKVAQDYNSLQIFDCPAYYYVREDKLVLRARRGMSMGFKKGMKDYKIWDPKDKKIILRRDVIFNEASMVKPINSLQVESEKINRIS